MSLEQKIMTDLKAAMIAKDEAALRSLRAVKAAILLAKTSEGGSGELKEEEEVKILQKLVKQRKDSLEIFKQQNREDLAKKEEEEIAVIEKFLPKQMTAEELKTEIAAIIANGIKNVKAITAVQVPGGGGAGAGGSAPSISAPVLPQAATTTLNQGQINQIGNTAARAFVLETDVSGNQERIKRLNRAARIN